jgi:thioredoxin 1
LPRTVDLVSRRLVGSRRLSFLAALTLLSACSPNSETTSALKSAHITTLTDTTFEASVEASATPIVVLFWAEWCGGLCKMMDPILDEISAEQLGSLTVAKLNIDENPAIVTRYNVQSVPAMLIFSNGELVDQVFGAISKSRLMEKLDKY